MQHTHHSVEKKKPQDIRNVSGKKLGCGNNQSFLNRLWFVELLILWCLPTLRVGAWPPVASQLLIFSMNIILSLIQHMRLPFPKGSLSTNMKNWCFDTNGLSVGHLQFCAVSDGSMSTSGSAGPGFDPGRGSKFSFENFQPRDQEGWRCTLSNC